MRSKSVARQGAGFLPWLPLIVVVLLVTILALVRVVRTFTTPQKVERTASAMLAGWNMTATAASLPEGSFEVEIEFHSDALDIMIPPPWPVVTAEMAGHSMPQQPLVVSTSPTSFKSVLKPPMAGTWTISVQAEDTAVHIPLQLP